MNRYQSLRFPNEYSLKMPHNIGKKTCIKKFVYIYRKIHLDIEMITLSFSTYCEMSIENQYYAMYNKSMPLKIRL